MNGSQQRSLSQFVMAQIALILALLLLSSAGVFWGPLDWDNDVSIGPFIAIPATVIAVSQLIIANKIQRATYIKDYALKYRSDKELTESFHYLVYVFGNKLYDSSNEDKQQFLAGQSSLDPSLRIYDPTNLTGCPQERRIDNLLGFFDTLGYDYCRDLINMDDIAGVFSFQLDHIIQRKAVNDYIKTVVSEWPNLDSFHTRYKAPIPFRYLRNLIDKYLEYQKVHNPIAR